MNQSPGASPNRAVSRGVNPDPSPSGGPLGHGEGGPGVCTLPVEVAALYVETGGAYFGLAGVSPWDESKDARLYAGPHPVVAHPPCQRWGRFWHGSTRKPHQFQLGDDGGCFAAALSAVRMFGGVLEHPCDSHAWHAFGLNRPPRAGGWVDAGDGGYTCCVYQGHYGHLAGKPTWLYARCCPDELPDLIWGPVEQRLHPVALARHGYEKARRIGMLSMVGGKDKTRIRNSTPAVFRDILLGLARSCTIVKQKHAWRALGVSV